MVKLTSITIPSTMIDITTGAVIVIIIYTNDDCDYWDYDDDDNIVIITSLSSLCIYIRLQNIPTSNRII